MYRDMRFCDGQDTSHTLGAELMERLADNVGACVMRGSEHGQADVVEIVEKAGVTILEFQQEVKT